MKRFLQSFANNLTTFMMAFILAVIIWASAVRAANPIMRETFELTVTRLDPPDAVILNTPATKVQMTVQAPRSVIESLQNRHFQAVIDLNGVSFEKSTVPIQIQYDTEEWPQVEIVAQFPPDTTVEMDRRISKDVPITVDIEGSIAPTSERGDPVTDYEFVTLTGPAARVNVIEEARVTVLLINARETRSVNRPIIFYDRIGNIVSTNSPDYPITISTDTVQVTIPINERAGVAQVRVEVDLTGKPADNYRFLDAIPDPRRVLVEGAPKVIDSLQTLKTSSIDITGLKSADTFRVDLVLPEGVQRVDVTDGASSAIVVDVQIEPILTTDIIDAPLQLVGLGENLAATLDAQKVRVVLAGPLEALDSLITEDVSASIDLFGLDVGTHQINPVVTIPIQSIAERSITPSTINVEIVSTLPVTETPPITDTGTITDTGIITGTESSEPESFQPETINMSAREPLRSHKKFAFATQIAYDPHQREKAQ